MKLTNPWIGYVERGYTQMMAAIRARISIEAPEITDLSYTNDFIKSASIFAGIGEHVNFYVDSRAREAYLLTCRDYASAVKFAAQVDYRVHGMLPAAVDLEFYVASASGTATAIPVGTIARTITGVEYRTTAAATLPAGRTSVIVPARNWKALSGALGVSAGQATQRFSLGTGVVDNNIVVGVGAVGWLPVETFAFSNSQDKHFRPSINAAGQMELTFGDGISGAIPGAGQAMSVSYYTSDGSLGNAAAGAIREMGTSLITSAGGTVQVRNPQRASGGTDTESLEELRRRIPLYMRTMERAVTRQDFIDTAMLAPGVAQAGLRYSCGEGVTIYVSPAGGGIASQELLDTVDNYFETRRIILTQVTVLAAGEVIVQFTGKIKVKPNYYRDATLALAKANLLEYMQPENQQIMGTLDIGNVYEVLENTEGVDVSEIYRMTTVPYARPDQHSVDLNWEVETQPGSVATLPWQITLTGNNELEILQGSNFIGFFGIGEQVRREEVVFTVLPGDYTQGQAWEFYTYPYNDSLTLAEQSVPVTAAEYINFTVTGGLV